MSSNSEHLKNQYPLVTWANSEILRTQCPPIKSVTKEIRSFAEDLLALMHAYDWVGLAAPQIWKPLRMAAFMQLDLSTKHFKPAAEDVMINPVILSSSKTTLIENEACLSLPWVEWDVARPADIVVQYTTMYGEKMIHKAKWYNARIILHELDHLDWVLFIDKLVE